MYSAHSTGEYRRGLLDNVIDGSRRLLYTGILGTLLLTNTSCTSVRKKTNPEIVVGTVVSDIQFNGGRTDGSCFRPQELRFLLMQEDGSLMQKRYFDYKAGCEDSSLYLEYIDEKIEEGSKLIVLEREGINVHGRFFDGTFPMVLENE